uniref:nucleotidyl transferase AbiEii/AbiGii toxin family protein n=1 Tax=Lentilactobacillus hilgardii TaxID=1588 RepID=UPI00403F139F
MTDINNEINKYAVKNQADPVSTGIRYAIERLSERISRSKYQNSLILKGGYLLGQLLNDPHRTTKDLDTALQEPVDKATVAKMLQEIIHVPLDDDMSFVIDELVEDRKSEQRFNPGYIISFIARSKNPDPTRKPREYRFSMDLTVNESIVPDIQDQQIEDMFDHHIFTVKAYPIEQIVAEKIEAIFHHGLRNTRYRDYYDLFQVQRLYGQDNIDYANLRQSIVNQFQKRHGSYDAKDLQEKWQVISTSKQIKEMWNQGRLRSLYRDVGKITFEQVIKSIQTLLERSAW